MNKKIILAAGLLTSVLWADFTLEYKMEGNMHQVVQYKDAKHVLITTGDASSGEGGAQLIVGDQRFMVIKQGGKTRYMDMNVMLAQMKQMGVDVQESAAEDEDSDFKIVKKGESKIVAGVEAEVWTIEYEEDGKKEQLDIVVTDDKRVVDAIYKYLDIMKQTSSVGQENDGLTAIMKIADGYATIAFDGMELVKFDESNIADSVYALPEGIDMGKK